MNEYFIIFALFACIFSIVSVLLALYACILAKSLEKATHSVQFMPVGEELTEKSFSNEEDMTLINEEQKEDNEEFFRMV